MEFLRTSADFFLNDQELKDADIGKAFLVGLVIPAVDPDPASLKFIDLGIGAVIHDYGDRPFYSSLI